MVHFNKALVENIKTIINGSKNIGLVTHQNPDGDTLGGAFALHYYLAKKKISSTIFCNKNYPEFFRWMLFEKAEKEIFFNVNTADLDAIFLIDHSLYSRSEITDFSIKDHSAKKIIIDHHTNKPDKADYTLLDPTSESACKLIFQLIEDCNETHLIDKKIASCLYTGIITDTGSFMHGSISISTFKTVEKLLEKGVNTHDIHDKIYQNFTLDRIKLLGYVLLNKINLISNGTIAYIILNDKELKKFNFKSGDTEGVVNYPLVIGGVKVAILIIEKKNVVKISFRSKNKIPVNLYAKKYFDGGGHLNAAGANSKKLLSEVVDFIKKTLPGFIQSLE